MTNQNKKIELNEIITISGIYQSIDSLEIKLKIYQSSKSIFNHRYEIQLELQDLYNLIDALKIQLADLNKQAEKWEALE